MLGQIIKIINSKIYIKLTVDLNQIQNIVNLYVVIQETSTAFIGEIISVENGIAEINLIGEYKNNKLLYGFIKKPSFNSKVSLLSPLYVSKLIGNNESEKASLLIGKSPFYEAVNVYANINSLFGNHFAIFGTTGAGKSCGFTRIIQNVFEKPNLSENMNIIIFDAYGEYHNAFQKISENSTHEFKTFTTGRETGSEPIRIPAWFLDGDDLAILLGVNKKSQMQIIDKTLRYVSLFKQKEENVATYKNNVIANAILDILQSGKQAAQIRDQIIGALSKFNTKDLNLESQIYQPGYTRTLRQCLLVDENGKINAIELLTEFLQSFLVKTNDMTISLPDGSFPYTLSDIYDALEIALIDEGIWASGKVFDDANILKVRLNSLLNSDTKEYFNYPTFIDKKSYIEKFLTAPSGRKAQIINLNINSVDDRFAKILVKIYSKLFFTYAKGLKDKAAMPFNIILEEAHRYIQKDIDVKLLGYNIFDRIAKEGRKYGVILDIISQRPMEISDTVIAQCSNFLIFKMTHPKDIKYIEEMLPNISQDVIEKMKILQPGTCVAFGSAFKIALICKLEMPNPRPYSSSCDVSTFWDSKQSIQDSFGTNSFSENANNVNGVNSSFLNTADANNNVNDLIAMGENNMVNVNATAPVLPTNNAMPILTDTTANNKFMNFAQANTETTTNMTSIAATDTNVFGGNMTGVLNSNLINGNTGIINPNMPADNQN